MNLLNHVQPLQGTDSVHNFSNGNTLPLVSVPFGMTSWSPQTTPHEERWFFHPNHRHFYGLRLTHQPSPWIGDYGHLLLLPQTGKLCLDPSWQSSSFLPEETIIKPNYYRVSLLRYRTVMELSPAMRSAALRFTFEEKVGARLLVAPFKGQSSVTINPDNRTISGYTKANSGGAPEGFAMYYTLQLDCDIDVDNSGLYDNSQEVKPALVGHGDALGAYVSLRLPESGIVNVVVGTSFISVAQAVLNAETEIGNRSLEEVRSGAEADWEDKLGRIVVESDDQDKLATFYSSMYRACLFPRTWHEYNQEGEQVHYSPHSGRVEPGPMYSDVGFWDIYRTVFPLHTILFPSLAAEMIQAWILAYKEGGWMPKWVSPGERSAMPGTLIDIIIGDAAAKGIQGFDLEVAYEGLLKHATVPAEDPMLGRRGLSSYQSLGYLPHDKFHESVSNSLDYMYGDFCISRIAERLGDEKNAEYLRDRSLNYVKLFDPATGFMRGRNEDGGQQEPFDPLEWGNPFCEGSAWQCSWAVQHDLLGLSDQMGGREKFAEKLDELFETKPIFKTGSYPGEIHEMSEMANAGLGQFAISNQPSFHIPYIYTALGYPEKAQYWVNKTLAEGFSQHPNGIPGDEDNGSMCTWYLFGALGLFPLSPGIPEYVLGSPLFKKAVIRLEEGKEFIIEADRAIEHQMYTSECQLNGDLHSPLFITHRQVMSGGHLLFALSEAPVEKVVDEVHLPYSLSKHEGRIY